MWLLQWEGSRPEWPWGVGGHGGWHLVLHWFSLEVWWTAGKSHLSSSLHSDHEMWLPPLWLVLEKGKVIKSPLVQPFGRCFSQLGGHEGEWDSFWELWTSIGATCPWGRIFLSGSLAAEVGWHDKSQPQLSFLHSSQNTGGSSCLWYFQSDLCQ